MKTLKLIMTKGLPGSGKSTWAKDLIAKEPNQWKRINKDDLRAMLDDGKWGKENEKFIKKGRDALILEALAHGYNVIVDDTNLSLSHEAHIEGLIHDKATFEIKDFTDVPLEECIKRDYMRISGRVGEKVIRNMYNQFLKPVPPVIEYNPKLTTAIVCDLDGTLALFGDANPYDRDFSKDNVNKVVLHILKNHAQEGHKILLVSGRSRKFELVTLKWLENNGVPFYTLTMRNEEDMRKDSIVKSEIYEATIKDLYNVLFVLDDRNQVVEFWRSLGLTCLQVAEGNF